MQGNYQHHYLMSAAAAASSASSSLPVASSKPSKSRQQQQQQVPHPKPNCDLNGLPTIVTAANSIGRRLRESLGVGGQSTGGSICKQATCSNQRQQQEIAPPTTGSRRSNLAGPQHNHFWDATSSPTAQTRHFSNQTAHQQLIDRPQRQANNLTSSSNINNNNNNTSNIGHKFHQQQAYERNELLINEHQRASQEQQYASQLRNSQLHHRYEAIGAEQPSQASSMDARSSSSRPIPVRPQQQQQQQPQPHATHHQAASFNSPGLAAPLPSADRNSSSQQQQQLSKSFGSSKEMHVNFNRSNQVRNDEEEGDGRKKKYLTAKYGQQQMNLIKKRLKAETWLYEQLHELSQGTKSQAELDEIDVDLDELLDMDGDDTRRQWLRKTLEPFEDLPSERLEKFINEVLDQLKLL